MTAGREQAPQKAALTSLAPLPPEAQEVGQLARTGPVSVEGSQLGVGAIIARIWQGHRHEVIVLEDGFRWNGRSFGSLSAVARAMTGTRWNGPRFFGLRVMTP